MNNNVDLNIDNYSIGELKNFFKLPKNYTNTELNKKVSEMESVVSSSESSVTKYETFYFINQVNGCLVGAFSIKLLNCQENLFVNFYKI